jgi:hypothetical protein
LIEERPGNSADLRCQADGGHQCHSGTTGHVGALPHHVAPVGHHRILWQFADAFRCGHGLPGQGRLDAAEVARFEQQGVGRYLVPFLQQDDVARHQFAGRHHPHGAAAPHLGRGREHVAQGLHSLLGAVLLHETDQRIDKDDRDDHPHVHRVAGEPGDEGRDGEDADQQALELVQQQEEPVALAGLGNDVRAVLAPPFSGLYIAQPLEPALLLLQGILWRSVV